MFGPLPYLFSGELNGWTCKNQCFLRPRHTAYGNGTIFAFAGQFTDTGLVRNLLPGIGNGSPPLLGRQVFRFLVWLGQVPEVRTFCEHYNSFGREGHVAGRCGGGKLQQQWFRGQVGPYGCRFRSYQLPANFRATQFY